MNGNDSIHHITSREVIEARFARRIAACLSENAQTIPHDVGERLRFGREKALAAAQSRRSGGAAQGVGVSASGAAILGFSRSHWWLRVASFLPLVALLGGLVLIQDRDLRAQISVAAEVDEALLGDDLPINAYRDAGFGEFLRAPPNE